MGTGRRCHQRLAAHQCHLPDTQQPVLNLLFYQGDTVVFADVIDEEQIKIASPVTFTYEPPFALPDFDRIEVRTL